MSNESFVIRRPSSSPGPFSMFNEMRTHTCVSWHEQDHLESCTGSRRRPTMRRGERGKIEEEAKKGLERKPVTVVGGIVGKRSAGSRRLFHPMVLTQARERERELGALFDTRPGMALLTTLVDLSPSPRRFAHSRNDAGTKRGFLPSRGEIRLIYRILILGRRKSPFFSSSPMSMSRWCT